MRNTPTDLILLEIAEGLKNLSQNPDLSESIKQAYALTEAEKAKAEDARKVIAEADQFLADLKAKEAQYADISDRISKAQAAEAFNEDALKQIAAKEKELAKKQTLLNSAQKQVAAEEKRLSDLAFSLDMRQKEIAENEKKIEAAKIELRKRAEIVGSVVLDL